MFLALTTSSIPFLQNLWMEFVPTLMVGFVWAPIIAAGIGAAASAYSARKAAKGMGSNRSPYGAAQPYIDQLLKDAYGNFQGGEFTFGPDPNVYNGYLDYGKKFGIDTSGFSRMTPGYGPQAYSWMMDYLMGPGAAFGNQQQQGPTQSPLAAGLMGGLGGYMAAGGQFGGGGGGSSVPISGAGIVDPAAWAGYGQQAAQPSDWLLSYYGLGPQGPVGGNL